MMNQIVLVGRLVKNIEEGSKYITLACPRSFKNAEGYYDTDFIDIKLFGTIVQSTMEYCRKGDLIGIKGRIEALSIDDGDGHYTKKTEIVADKVTFLSSRKESE